LKRAKREGKIDQKALVLRIDNEKTNKKRLGSGRKRTDGKGCYSHKEGDRF